MVQPSTEELNEIKKGLKGVPKEISSVKDFDKINSGQYVINRGNLPNGIYLINVIAEGKLYSKKIEAKLIEADAAGVRPPSQCPEAAVAVRSSLEAEGGEQNEESCGGCTLASCVLL